MTDLEMTKLCAAAMGNEVLATHHGALPLMVAGVGVYNPLHDDAQAMALAKRFRFQIDARDDDWCVTLLHDDDRNEPMWASATDLNRAIVSCVAKMQSQATVPG